jgi:hypothetical protein
LACFWAGSPFPVKSYGTQLLHSKFETLRSDARVDQHLHRSLPHLFIHQAFLIFLLLLDLLHSTLLRKARPPDSKAAAIRNSKRWW